MAEKIVFLDRDGVINEFPGNGKYVTKVKEFRFLPGTLEALRELTKDGYDIFIVSNQAGVGKGVYTQKKLDHITRNMMRDITRTGGKVRQVFYCVHHPEDGCDCRKPRIGSVQRALEMLGMPLSAAKDAYFIGDTKSDIEAGHVAGCKTIFVLSGREDRRYVAHKWLIRPDYVAQDLKDALRILIPNGTPLPKRYYYNPPED
ncbi:MAG TPA: HAD family hydrolase [Candidatus Omnitrophota bacterium]|nr:HAD family hydrolase [Candidatus Omnitrophota bacterium]HSA31002.1 HAD family hydrolase [Candidatus Omnitrophota bacterium]